MCSPDMLQGTAVLMQGIAADKAAKANARMYTQQARLLDESAKRTEAQGLKDEESVRRQVRQFMGGQRAAAGASGIVGTEGSVALLQDEAAMQGEIDALTTRNNAYLEAWGIRTNANTARNQGRIERAVGRNTLLTSAISASSYFAKAGEKPVQMFATNGSG